MTRFEVLTADFEYVQPPAAARSSADAMLVWCVSNDLDRLEVCVFAYMFLFEYLFIVHSNRKSLTLP